VQELRLESIMVWTIEDGVFLLGPHAVFTPKRQGSHVPLYGLTERIKSCRRTGIVSPTIVTLTAAAIGGEILRCWVWRESPVGRWAMIGAGLSKSEQKDVGQIGTYDSSSATRHGLDRLCMSKRMAHGRSSQIIHNALIYGFEADAPLDN